MLISKPNTHGGDVYSKDISLDFSANTNPFGMPEEVLDAVVNSAKKSAYYPDAYCTALRKKTAVFEGVGKNQLLFGNGATELLYSFALSLPRTKKALIVAPAFCEYANALSSAELEFDYYITKKENAFILTEDFLKLDFSPYSAVFLCSPSNPAGALIDETIIRRVLETGVRVLLDLSFVDLTENPKMYNIAELINSFDGLTVLRAFTKSFALAGIRLGYVISSDSILLEKMSEKTQCWNVSVPAQEAGIAALDCYEWLKNTVKTIQKEKKRLKKALCDMGISVFDGEANFLLLYSEKDLYKELLNKKILVRDCSDYVGLGKGYIRIAVRTEDENSFLLSAISEALK